MEMKDKKLKFMFRYKYAYFILSSFVLSLVCTSIPDLISSDPITLNGILKNTLLGWGFFYITSFVIFEQAKKHNKEKWIQYQNKY